METEMMTYALRDPAGVPTHPIVFFIVGIATWALHIAAVAIMLGGATLAILGSYKNDTNWHRLAHAMVDVSKIAVSVAIVIGVAPLLTTQVIYDPFWYTSNVLSAWWVIAFVGILIVGYWFMYFFYFRNYSGEKTEKPKSTWSLIVSVALLLFVGWIMHVLSVQTLYPEQWQEWYAPNGQLDTSGTGMHAYNFWRYAFFISLAAPVIGAWLVAYRRYFMAREDSDQAYLDWAGNLGLKLMNVGGVVTVLLGVAWMLTLPEKTAGFATSIWAFMALAALLGFAAIGIMTRSRMDSWGYVPMIAATVAGIVIALSREMLRYVTLNGVHGYNFMDYTINMDWYSTIMFFATFIIVGGLVLGYLLTVAWKAGQTKGVYVPSGGVQTLGKLAVWSIAIWILQYFVAGFWVLAQ